MVGKLRMNELIWVRFGTLDKDAEIFLRYAPLGGLGVVRKESGTRIILIVKGVAALEHVLALEGREDISGFTSGIGSAEKYNVAYGDASHGGSAKLVLQLEAVEKLKLEKIVTMNSVE